MDETINITRIEFQNKRSKKYFLYEHDTFLAEILEDTFVNFAISRGQVLSKQEFKKILIQNRINECLEQSYSYLSRRPHLTKELFTKLKNKHFEKDVIEKTLEKLKQKKYLNDKDYIRLYITDSLKQKKSGPLLIKMKLSQKGAAIDLVNSILNDLFPEKLQVQIATEILTKKNKTLVESDPQKKVQKLYQFGLGRGFTWQTLSSAVTRIINSDDYVSDIS